MLTLDTQAQQRWKRAHTVERTRELTEQAWANQLEANARALMPDGRIPVTDAEAQLGQVMHINELVTKVRAANPNLIYEQSKNYPDKGGFYAYKPDPADPLSNRKAIKVMVASCKHGWIPEFSVRLVKQEETPDALNPGNRIIMQVPTGVEMGWRTTIARLVRGGYLTRADIDQHFPRMLRDSMYWHQTMIA